MIRKVLLNVLAFLKIFLVSALFIAFLVFLVHLDSQFSCTANCPCS